MRKYFFSFLLLFFSACSSDSKLDKSDYPFSFSIQTVNKYPNQKEGSNLVKDQQVKINTNANADTGTGTSVDAGTNADIDISTNIGAVAGTGTDVGVENLKKNRLEEFSFVTVQQAAISTDAGSGSITGVGSSADTGAGVDIVQKTAYRATQELTDFNRGGHFIQKEICEGFSKADWTNQGLSIKQAVQHFTRKQMQNLLSINREFPSPQDKEDSVRCFVNTAFSLNSIFKTTTDYWWTGVQEPLQAPFQTPLQALLQVPLQAPLQAPHKETLIGFIEHYFVAWVGYGLLSPIKSIPSDRIDFVVEEPRLLKNKQYAVVTNFNIMNFYSVEIIWTVDARSFPEELAFLDIFVEGVSILYLLRNQMHYLFQKKDGDMNEVVFDLQNKMDDSSFAYL